LSNEDLERQLFLKQLQINRLLDITQAINNNVKADGLFEMYKSFLNWELGVRKMALFIEKNDDWYCACSIGIENYFLNYDIKPSLISFGVAIKKLKGVTNDPFIEQFDMVIPVFHKDEAIAYAFVGEYESGDFSKIQLITTITNIVSVAIENKRLFKRQIEQARFNHEMSLASEMQRSLVPNVLPKEKLFEVAAVYQPHFGVGGDYYDFFKYREDRYLLVVADIAGKGLAAALLMANFQANLHAIIRRTNSPEDFIEQVNKAVVRITKSDRYLTLFVCDLDIKTNRLRYINAGHIPPVLVIQDKVQYLSKGCTILGYFNELPSMEVGEVYLEEDALLCVFTDGITDVRDPEGSYFNEKILGEFAISNAQLSAKDFNEKLMSKIEKFKGDEEFPDDITVLTCKFLKSGMRKDPSVHEVEKEKIDA
jgi:phosphoserine phosphatase RsbU/P